MRLETAIDLELEDATIVYYPYFFSIKEANELFQNILKNTPWQQDNITVFGKTYLQPRLTAFYANNLKKYAYSNIVMTPHRFSGDILMAKKTIEKELPYSFTSCLANLYRNGKDSNGWHADNEKELGSKPVIASLSLGSERTFHLKHKKNKTLKTKLKLLNGSLLLMSGDTQNNWLHQIPKTKKEIGERINLTFRIIA